MTPEFFGKRGECLLACCVLKMVALGTDFSLLGFALIVQEQGHQKNVFVQPADYLQSELIEW